MKHSLFPLCAVLLILIGCASQKTPPSLEKVIEYRDSVRTEYIERTVFVPDTVFVEIPLQVAERETRDSVSTLENDYAWSVARITTDGILFHSLYTKPQLRPVTFDKPIMTITSNNNHTADKSESKTATKIEYVEKDLSYWQRFRLDAFWWMALAIVVMVGWVVRKPMAGIIKRLV